MGPALREGHWTPEDYSNYGDRKNAKFTPPEISTDDENNNEVQFIWDKNYLPDEQHNYYEEGVNQNKVYYPVCYMGKGDDRWVRILLDHEQGTPCLYFYDGPTEAQSGSNAAQYYKIISLGAGMKIIFIEKPDESNTQNNEQQESTPPEIIPAIMITESLTPYELGLLYKPENAQIGIPTWDANGKFNGDAFKETWSGLHWNIDPVYEKGKIKEGTTKEIVQRIPRIRIKNLDLMTSEDKLALKYGQDKEITLQQADSTVEPAQEAKKVSISSILSEYEDYSLLLYAPEGSTVSSIDSYAITLKEQELLKRSYVNAWVKVDEGTNKWNFGFEQFNLLYYISNASTAIYLDAKTILKENAYPKVTYSLTPNVLNTTIHKNLYRFLARIININDVELKLHEAYGYISELELDLDHPWNDTITVQNYKNKFEDIFSTITVQTEAMQRREYQLNEATQLVDVVTKQVNPEMLQKTLDTSLLNYDFNDGQLTFDNEQGITGISSQGVIAIRSSGIFTASSKDEDGNWQWNSAIVPTGINANLIKAGQLDTQKILIYSGNDVRFQWNGDGIYAYKTDYRGDPSNAPKDYVLFNKNGLILQRTQWTDNSTTPPTITTTTPIVQVEVGWNGFIMRNKNGDNVFEADKDGNLSISGKVTANEGTIGGWEITDTALKNNNMLLRGKDDSNEGGSPGGGKVGIFTTPSSIYNNFIEYEGNTYYLFTFVGRTINNKSQGYHIIAPNEEAQITYDNIEDFNNAGYYTFEQTFIIEPKYFITYNNINYLSWVDPNSYSFSYSSVTEDPRIIKKSVESDGTITYNPIKYDGNDEWYNDFKLAFGETTSITVNGEVIPISANESAYVKTISIYKQTKIEAADGTITEDEENQLTTKLSTQETTFSLEGETGKITTNYGQLGSFSFNAEKISDGTLASNVSFEINDTTKKTFFDLGQVIVGVKMKGTWGKKTLVFTRLNGETITLPDKWSGKEWYIPVTYLGRAPV